MIARYPGTCSATGRPIKPGDEIQYDRRTRRAILLEPNAPIDPEEVEYLAGIEFPTPQEDAELRAALERQSRGAYISHVIRTSGGTFYRNKRGLCEDAPCCGCCTI